MVLKTDRWVTGSLRTLFQFVCRRFAERPRLMTGVASSDRDVRFMAFSPYSVSSLLLRVFHLNVGNQVGEFLMRHDLLRPVGHQRLAGAVNFLHLGAEDHMLPFSSVRPV